MTWLASLVLAASTALAQVDPDAQAWSAVLTTVDLSRDASGPSLWLDTHVRRGGAGTTAIIRPAVGWRASKSVSVWGGYAWIPFFDDATGRREEHRTWQQLTVGHTKGPLALQSRTRFEQRYGGPDVGFRVRQFGRLGYRKDPWPVGLVVWDELFVGVNDVSWGPQAGYDQNRLFAGAFAKVDDWGRLEVGYLLAHLNRDPDQVVHSAAINLFVIAKPKG